MSTSPGTSGIDVLNEVKQKIFSEESLKVIQDIHQKIDHMDNIYIRDSVVWRFKNGRLEDPQTLINFLRETFETDEIFDEIHGKLTKLALITAVALDVDRYTVNNISVRNKLGILVNEFGYDRKIFQFIFIYLFVLKFVIFVDVLLNRDLPNLF